MYFDMNYTNRTEFLEEHKRVLESRLQPVMREITGNILNMTIIPVNTIIIVSI